MPRVARRCYATKTRESSLTARLSSSLIVLAPLLRKFWRQLYKTMPARWSSAARRMAREPYSICIVSIEPSILQDVCSRTKPDSARSSSLAINFIASMAIPPNCTACRRILSCPIRQHIWRRARAPKITPFLGTRLSRGPTRCGHRRGIRTIYAR